MNKFNNGKIYKIVNDINDECYIGSTCNSLVWRWNMHKTYAKCSELAKTKFYKYINEIGIEHFKIELFEEYPCENKEQLLKREGYFINLYGTLNHNSAGNNNFNIKEWNKQYREQHKEEIKLYRDNNKEIQKEYNKQYYEKNREKHIKKMCEKTLCACGKYVQYGKQKRHQQTKLHEKLLSSMTVLDITESVLTEPVIDITESENYT